MRQTVIAGAAAALTAIVTIWGSTVIGANVRQGAAASATPLLGVMQMMRDARDLPVEQYDAF